MKRNIVITLLLMLFTCGIYYLYLIYQLSSEVDDLAYEHRNSPSADLILSIVTCGLYTIYWFYKIGRQVEELQMDLGMRTSSIALLGTILCVFGFGSISMLSLVSEINRCIDEKEAIY